jgi:hypothetical protein
MWQRRSSIARATTFCTVALIACSSTAPEADRAEGPRIPLDSAAVSQVRSQWHATDSLLRTPDNAPRDREARAFIRAIADMRIVTAQNELARLGYEGSISGELDSRTRRAFREFARHHGLQSTDSLTPEMDVALRYADDRAFYPFGLRDSSISTAAWALPRNASTHAIGTWSPADPPRQTSNIWCYRDARICREAVAYVLAGELYTDIVEYDVDQWDAEELTAHSTSLCMSDKLTINRSRASAVLVRSARGPGVGICDQTRSANRESVARLVSGRIVSNSLAMQGLPFLRLGPKAAALMKKLLDTVPTKP